VVDSARVVLSVTQIVGCRHAIGDSRNAIGDSRNAIGVVGDGARAL
jgi:hypothetical protein